MSKDNKMGRQAIECSVYDCKHCNCDDECCLLDKIKVCDNEYAENKQATMCDSYEER